jgi:PAS domain S-box-containing protein
MVKSSKNKLNVHSNEKVDKESSLDDILEMISRLKLQDMSNINPQGDQGILKPFSETLNNIAEKIKVQLQNTIEDRARLHALFTQSRDAIMTLSPPSWKFTNCNPAALNLFQVSSVEDFIQLGPWNLSPEYQPDGRLSSDKAQEAIKRAMDTGSYYFDWNHINTRGDILNCNVLLSRVDVAGEKYLQATVRDVTELKSSEYRNQQIFNSIDHAAIVAFTDIKGKITYVNDNFCHISGYTREELIGKDHRILNSGAHPKSFFKEMWKTLQDGKTWTADIENKKKSGEHYFVRTVISPIKSVNGTIEQYMTVRFDVTEQKIVEKELIEAQSTAKIGSWKYNLSTGHQVWSSEHYQIFEIEGPQSQADLYRLYRERIHPEDRAQLDFVIKQALNRGEDFIYNHRVYLDNGSRIKHVRGIGKVTKDSSGKPIYISGTCQDLTDIVALQEQNKFILESMGIGIWKYNPRTLDLFWDDSMYRLYELNATTFSGHYQAWESCLSPETKAKAVEALNLAISGKKEFDTTFEINTSSGVTKKIGGRGVVIRNASNEAIMMYGINWDRTHEDRLEKSLNEERTKALHNAKLASLGEMAAGIAHEINNPLAVITGSVSLLSKFKNDNVKFDSQVKTISKSAERIEKIVKGLRKFSRTADGSDHKVESVLNLVSEALILTEPKSKRFSTPIITNIDQELSITCDSVEIEQVLVNLINNGIDAVKNLEEKWLKINVFSDNNEVVLQVIDSGLGIPLEIEKKLFEPFFTTKAVGEGTGLGLSITKGILDAHKASFSLNRSFRNTCFEVRFKKSYSKHSKQAA